ncbi:RICIN domain-containing protein [Streptomyces sp. NPDC050856]|uniref:RICIN domain-containing protein n=1 Tax=Streptomyces sp. NPDC050856 TaxID=3154939 RepID=UPI0033EFA19F
MAAAVLAGVVGLDAALPDTSAGDGNRAGAGTNGTVTAPQAAAASTTAPRPAAEPAREAEPKPLKEIPKSEPKRGLVYDGLRVAAKGDRCAGVLRTSTGHCTHGPDAPPKGVDIKKDTPPAVRAEAAPHPTDRPADRPTGDKPPAGAARPAGPGGPGAPAVLDASTGRAVTTGVAGGTPAAGTKTPSGPTGQTVQCDGDGSTGNRVQVVYAHAPGRDRYAQYWASFKKWAADADVIYAASAQETGGVRHIRYVTDADCTPTVLSVELPAAAMAEFSAMNKALAGKGFNRRDRKYMIFADAQVYCGIGTFNGDERPGQDNLSNFGPSYGRTDSGCWGGFTAAHELGHNLGAVNNSAPNTSRGAHCTDEWDVMCYSDSPYYPTMRNVCADRRSDERLDCNHDDYFHTNPRPGSYLATHWNIADNQFLMRRGGTRPDPTPTPTPTPTPNPGPTAGPDVTVGQITPDSAMVSWPAVSSAAWYQLVLNGRPMAWVQSSVARVYNLTPDTSYTIAVAVRDRNGRDSRPGRAASFRTAKAGGTVTPAARHLLANGSTGVTAEIWGGRTADGTVLVGSQRNGTTAQQWYFDDAGGGYTRVRSAASGKCLQVGGAPVAGQWVAQQPCGNAASQQWRFTGSGNGVKLTAKGGSLVLGVSNRPYHGAWLLELQHSDSNPAQVWTAERLS